MTDTETGVDSPQPKKKNKDKLKYSFSTIERINPKDHCYYSGLPSPSAYGLEENEDEETDK
jgi:hypothetical protein